MQKVIYKSNLEQITRCNRALNICVMYCFSLKGAALISDSGGRSLFLLWWIFIDNVVLNLMKTLRKSVLALHDFVLWWTGRFTKLLSHWFGFSCFYLVLLLYNTLYSMFISCHQENLCNKILKCFVLVHFILFFILCIIPTSTTVSTVHWL